jgi:hypothetical protein
MKHTFSNGFFLPVDSGAIPVVLFNCSIYGSHISALEAVFFISGA